jgi:hypothetical protein
MPRQIKRVSPILGRYLNNIVLFNPPTVSTGMYVVPSIGQCPLSGSSQSVKSVVHIADQQGEWVGTSANAPPGKDTAAQQNALSSERCETN